MLIIRNAVLQMLDGAGGPSPTVMARGLGQTIQRICGGAALPVEAQGRQLPITSAPSLSVLPARTGGRETWALEVGSSWPTAITGKAR